MSDEKALAVQESKQEIDLQEWRSRQEIHAMGKRIKTMLPNGNKLSDEQAMALGQYSLVMGANPYRGESYAFEGKGGFQLVEGYKLLVRWAKRQCPYSERYEPTPGIPEQAIGMRCFVLRQDQRPAMRDYVQMGATFKESREMVETFADGIVQAGEMNKEPPKGWTWEQVARKRALKNALNLSHGAPSLTEIAAQSWDVNGTQTQPEDWQGPGITPGMSNEDRTLGAEYNAQAREAHEHAKDVTAAQAADELFDDYPGDGDKLIYDVVEEPTDDSPPTAAEQTNLAPNWVNDPDVTQRVYIWLGKQKLANGETISKELFYQIIGVESSLKEFTGSPGDVKTLVRKWIEAGKQEAE